MKKNITFGIARGFDSELVYNEKYLKTKLKTYEGKINASFLDDKMHKKSSYCTCLSVILIVPVLKMGKSYYPQAFLDEWKWKNNGNKYINDDLKNFF